MSTKFRMIKCHLVLPVTIEITFQFILISAKTYCFIINILIDRLLNSVSLRKVSVVLPPKIVETSVSHKYRSFTLVEEDGE